MISMISSKVLVVVDGDHALAERVTHSLQEVGYDCDVLAESSRGAARPQTELFDVVILDFARESESCLQVLRDLRSQDPTSSIVIMAPRETPDVCMSALDEGADDFVMKPFTDGELLARVRAVQVRARTLPKSQLEVGPISMDLTSRKVTRDGNAISLTPTEFRILEILMRNHAQVVTRQMLCETLWNPDWEGVTNVIEVHMNRLRTKLCGEETQKLIHTVRGSGYVLRCEQQSVA